MERSLSGLERGPGKLVYRKVPRVRILGAPPKLMEYKQSLKNVVYKFCPKCGNESNLKAPNLLICKNCDYNFYINPAPTNAIIIENDKGEILLAKRKFEPKKGFLDLPGGFIEIGESAEESSVREAKEELGVDVTDVKYLSSYPDEYLYQGVLIKTLGLTLSAKIEENQTMTPADDVEEVTFYKKDEIPYDKIAFESIKRGLVDYIKQK